MSRFAVLCPLLALLVLLVINISSTDGLGTMVNKRDLNNNNSTNKRVTRSIVNAAGAATKALAGNATSALSNLACPAATTAAKAAFKLSGKSEDDTETYGEVFGWICEGIFADGTNVAAKFINVPGTCLQSKTSQGCTDAVKSAISSGKEALKNNAQMAQDGMSGASG